MFLYHGTDRKSADDIIKRGIDMSKSDKGYFGRGFYTATDEALAKSNYADFSGDDEESGVVLKFSLKPNTKILDLDIPEDFETYKSTTWRGIPISNLIHRDDFHDIMVSLGFDGLRDEGSFGGIVIYNPDAVRLEEEMKFATVNQALQFLADTTSNRIIISKIANRIEAWNEDAEDYDPWVAADQADAVMKNSGIRPDRNKELAFIAFDDSDNVVGAAFDSVINSEGYGQEYSFDVAVDKEYRSGIGIELIKACIERADELPERVIRLWVINPKLVGILERRFGFDIEQQHSDGSAHMVKN